MTELKAFLDRVAEEARVYDVTERALAAGRRRRRVRRLAVPSGAAGLTGAIVAAVAMAGGLAPGTTAASPSGSTTSGTTSGTASTATSGVSAGASSGVWAGPSGSPEPAAAADPDAGFPTACVAERLPTPTGHGPKSVVTGGDPTGRYLVGRSSPGRDRDRLIIWDSGRIAHVVPMDGEDPDLVDVNADGLAVGTSFIGKTLVGWVVRDGQATVLKGGVPRAVNRAGLIVGGDDQRAILWRTPDAPPEPLPTPKGFRGYASDVDDDGTIVGGISKGEFGRLRPYVWFADGTARELAFPRTVAGHAATSAGLDAIRNGWVAGSTDAEAKDKLWFTATRWNLRTGEVTELPELGRTKGVSAQGWVVGEVLGRGVLVSPTHRTELPPAVGMTTVVDVRAVSEDGRVVGGYVTAKAANTDVVAVRWRCA